MSECIGIDVFDHPLSSDEQQALRKLVGVMIPASTAYGVPGADDAEIFARTLAASDADAALIAAGLRALDDLSLADCGKGFVLLDDDDRAAVAHRFAQSAAPHVSAIVAVTARCYYSDERVMDALGMAARPPFPKGYEVEQGDWSLLDPVKKRPAFYRKA